MNAGEIVYKIIIHLQHVYGCNHISKKYQHNKTVGKQCILKRKIDLSSWTNNPDLFCPQDKLRKHLKPNL